MNNLEKNTTDFSEKREIKRMSAISKNGWMFRIEK